MILSEVLLFLLKIKTHPITLFHEILPADVSHDARGQRVPHHVHHGAESVSVEEEDIRCGRTCDFEFN